MLAGNTVGVRVPPFALEEDRSESGPSATPEDEAAQGVVDEKVDDGRPPEGGAAGSRAVAAAVLLEQAALLARGGHLTEAVVLLRAAHDVILTGQGAPKARP